jgi:hypothetical protein
MQKTRETCSQCNSAIVELAHHDFQSAKPAQDEFNAGLSVGILECFSFHVCSGCGLTSMYVNAEVKATLKEYLEDLGWGRS